MQTKLKKVFRFVKRHNSFFSLLFLVLFASAIYSAYPQQTNAYYKKIRYFYLDRSNILDFNNAICAKGKNSFIKPFALFFSCPLNTIVENKQPLLQKQQLMQQKIKTKSENFLQAIFGEEKGEEISN